MKFFIFFADFLFLFCQDAATTATTTQKFVHLVKNHKNNLLLPSILQHDWLDCQTMLNQCELQHDSITLSPVVSLPMTS